MPTKTVQVQPGMEVLRNQARTVSGAARVIGVPDHELRNALNGRYRPSRAIRERLPLMVGVPITALFSADMLAEDPEAVTVA
jgi:hypothetical protein